MVKRPLAQAMRRVAGRNSRANLSLTSLLTRRQGEVIGLVAEGLGNKEIAVRLDITVSGVRRHLEALTRRYGVSGRTSLVRAAIEAGEVRIGVKRKSST